MIRPLRLSVVLVWRDPGEGVVEALRTLVEPVGAAGDGRAIPLNHPHPIDVISNLNSQI